MMMDDEDERMMSGKENGKEGRRTQVKNARGKCMYYKGVSPSE